MGGRAGDHDRRGRSTLTDQGARAIGRGEAYAALAASAFGSAYVATAFALRSFEPLVAAVYRSLVAAVALAVVVWIARRGQPPAAGAKPPRTRVAMHLAILGALGGAIFLVAMNLAVAGVGATIASFVAGLYAVLAAVIAPLVLRERLRPRALVAFVVALVGTALLAELDLTADSIGGIAWGLAGAASFALFLVFSRKWGREDGLDGLLIGLATMTVAAVALGLIVLLTRPASLLPSRVAPEALAAMVWLVVTAAGGLALAPASVKLIPASRSAAFLLLNPIVAAVLSAILLGERPSGVQMIGGALVLAGIAAATLDPGVFRPRRTTSG